MKERHLLVLRPNQYNDGSLRLGLFTDDYHNHVQGKNVCALYINFFAANQRITSIKTYLNHGSIAKKSIIDAWLQQSGFTERTLLLFELITDNDAGIHIYNFLSKAEDAITLIKKAENKVR